MMQKKNIAILEDEKDIAFLMRHNLEKEGFDVATFHAPEDFIQKASTAQLSLIVLDLMLPGMNGLEILRLLRGKKETKNTPVIIVTARDSEGDRILGLELGADDYITKPFSVREFVARVKTVLRRTHPAAQDDWLQNVSVGPVRLDLGAYQVFVDDRKIETTKTEFMILKLLLSSPGKVMPREQMLEQLWGNEKYVLDRTVDVHIKRLRDKLGKHGCCIKTCRGVGYIFEGFETTG